MTKLTTEKFNIYKKIMDQMKPAELRIIKGGSFPQDRIDLLNKAGVTVQEFYKYVKFILV